MIKKKKDKNIFGILFKLLPVIIKASPALFIVLSVFCIFDGLARVVNIIFLQRFFDDAAQLAQGNATIANVFLSLGLLGGVNILIEIINGFSNLLPTLFHEKAVGKLNYELNKKISRIHAVKFESTESLDEINKASTITDSVAGYINAFVFAFALFTPYYIYMAVYLYSLKPILVISLVIIFIPTTVSQFFKTKIFSDAEDKTAPLRRENEYYEKCIVDREYFKETRFLGGFSYFARLYRESLENIHKIQIKADIKANFFELCMKILTVIGYLGVLYLLFIALMQGDITVGAFAAVFASLGRIFMLTEEFITFHIGHITSRAGRIKNYIRLLEWDERNGVDVELDDTKGIEIKNIYFKYPDAKENAINGISLNIKNGETIAIVGENGSGKSTLIRLLTGLYLPDSGIVINGGHSTADVSMKSLFKGVSAVFQKYQRYKMTLRNNIGISDVDKIDDNDKQMDDYCQMAGFSKDADSLTDGYDTMLSREFNGVDLSGGQWQRVAIARGFYRRHKLIILDEPTAAIDPLEETRIYNSFAEISRDKTAIIVTHRLGSVRLADRIIVMKKGRIVERGSHDELMKVSGEYARMYESQRQWYE